MAERQWYYVRGKKQEGPVSETQMQQLINSGAVNRSTLVWSEPMKEWVTAEKAGTFQFPPAGAAICRPITMSGGANVLTFLHPVLDSLAEGKVIRAVVAYALRLFGVLTVLGGIYFFVEIMKIAFSQYMPTTGSIGGIILGLVLLAAVAAVLQIMFYRAKSITALGESSFTVIPILSILLRAFGESYAALLTALGVGGCIVISFGAGDLMYIVYSLLPIDIDLPGGGGFLGGILLLVIFAVAAFAVILIFYFLAEAVVALVDIAKNTKQLVKASKDRETMDRPTASS